MMEMEELFRQKIADRTLQVAVYGLGYVGLPLALEFAKKGYSVLGIDVNADKVAKLNAGENYIQDLDDAEVREVVQQGYLRATTELTASKDADAIFICVPTPFTDHKDPDISYILQSAEAIVCTLRPGQVVILKSTTFPGTTNDYVLPILSRSGLEVGKDYFLAFSPERIDPGNKKWTTANTPVVVGGVTPQCTELATLVQGVIVDTVVPVSSPRVAEMTKLLENIFRSVNIALVNELAQLCDRMGGINIWEVVEAAATKPFGYMPFYPGPGIGGHCILIDPYYLSWAARKYDFVTNFITLAAEVNESMPFYVRELIEREIARQPVSLADAQILILGVAFKRDVDDLRHSPALKVIELLQSDQVQNIAYYDPYIPEIWVDGQHYTSIPALTPAVLQQANVVVITTDHSNVDYQMVVDHSRAVIDTRNACKNTTGDKRHVLVLGGGQR